MKRRGTVAAGGEGRTGDRIRILLLALVALLAGCSYRIATLTLISNQSVSLQPQVVKRGVTGERCKIEWTAGLRPTLDEAMEDALRGVPDANAMTNVVAENTSYFLVLLNRNCMEVKGDAVRIGQ